MFHEPHGLKGRHEEPGWIEVICGSMFSGKTEELLRRLRRAEIAGLRVELFKPKVDRRYSQKEVVSHEGRSLKATTVDFAEDIALQAGTAQVVGIDEAQFLDNSVVEVANRLANQGKRVVIAGLDMDYQGKPFGPMPYLLAVAEFVTKLHAICQRSGSLANYTHRLTDDPNQVALGAQEAYEARSRKYFYLHPDHED